MIIEVITMLTGKIHSIETMGLLDGPGIRTVVFMQGCPLKCSYCHNPDTQSCFSDKQKNMSVEELVRFIKNCKNAPKENKTSFIKEGSCE